MTGYLLLKTVHVVSATLLFGTGLGTAFHMWSAHRTGDPRAIAAAARSTVRADWLFTVPPAVVQLFSGILLARWAGYPLQSSWLMAAISLYFFAGACWLPVAVLQIRAARWAGQAVALGVPLPRAYYRTMQLWFWLGWPAFASLIAVFWLMVDKPALW